MSATLRSTSRPLPTAPPPPTPSPPSSAPSPSRASAGQGSTRFSSVPFPTDILASSRPSITGSVGIRLFPTVVNGGNDPGSTSSLPNDQGKACRLQDPNDALSWTAFTLMAIGLFICGFFLRRSWLYWHNYSATKLRTAFSSPATPNAILATPGATPTASGSFRSAGAASGHDIESDGTWDSQHHPARRRPRFRSVATLMLLAWSIFFVDQVALGLYISFFHWVCPQFNCRFRVLVSTPGCAAPIFLLGLVYLQPVGAALFVLATISRFIRVFRVLSQPRYLAIKFGSGVVIFTTVFRLFVLFVAEFVRRAPERFPIGSPTESFVDSLNSITYIVTYGVFGVLDLASLILGLQYVLLVRSEVRSLRQSALVSSVKPRPRNLLDKLKAAAAQGSVRGFDAMERKTGIVLGWISASILVLMAFTVLTFAPGPLKRTPITFDNSLFTLFLKLFTAAVSMAISGVTDIIATRDHQ